MQECFIFQRFEGLVKVSMNDSEEAGWSRNSCIPFVE